MSARSRAGWTSKSTSFQYAIIFRMSSWLSASKTITSGASLLSEPQKPTVRRPAGLLGLVSPPARLGRQVDVAELPAGPVLHERDVEHGRPSRASSGPAPGDRQRA